MSSEKEFDDIFRKKSEEAKFNFQASDWEKARKMIDKERLAEFNQGSRFNYWYLSAVIVLVASFTFYFAYPEVSESEMADEVIYTNEISVPKQFEKKDFLSKNSNRELSIKSTENSVASKSQNKLQSRNLPESSPQERKEGAIQNTKFVSQSSISNPISPKTEVKFTETDYAESNNGFSNSPNEDQIQFNSNLKPGLLNSTMETVASKINRLSNSFVEIDPIYSTVFLKRYNDDYVITNSSKFYVDLELGVNYFLGWENNGSVAAKGINGFGGIQAGYVLNKHFSLSLGTQIYNLDQINQQFYSGTSKIYDFGSTQTQTLISCQSMVFVSFPLRFYYSPDERHSIGLGLNAGALVSAVNQIETHQLSDGLVMNREVSSSKTLYESMSSTNFIVSASIAQKIGSRVHLNVELNYGLSDLFQDTPTNNQHQNSSGVRVGLNYRIFKN